MVARVSGGCSQTSCLVCHNEVKDIRKKRRINERTRRKTHRINEWIRAKEVRLIGEQGERLGILPLREALEIAKRHDLDLVEVAPQADPPVCRLLDYGKYVYERSRKAREAKKVHKPAELKEIRLRPKTGKHDVDFKIKRMRDFLSDGSKVKVRVLFRGREITHPEIAHEMLSNIAAHLQDIAVVEYAPRMEGRTMFMILSPVGKK